MLPPIILYNKILYTVVTISLIHLLALTTIVKNNGSFLSSPDSVCFLVPAACVQSHSEQTPSFHWVAPAETADHVDCPQTQPPAAPCLPGSVTPLCEHGTWHHYARPLRREEALEVRDLSWYQCVINYNVLIGVVRAKCFLVLVVFYGSDKYRILAVCSVGKG